MIEFRFRLTDFDQGFEIAIVEKDERGRVTHVAKNIPLEMEPIEEGIASDWTIRLRGGERIASQMMSELARIGIKPESESKLEGELKATRIHLEDMKRLVFDQGVNIEKETWKK